MAQAPEYSRTKNFNENAGDRTDHAALNAELDGVAQSINGLRSNLAVLQNDDGSMRNEVVTLDALTSEAREALSVPGPKGEPGVQGVPGIQGPPGPIGGRGPSFDADVRDLLANRGLYDLRGAGFSFLAMDAGLLFFKLSGAAGDWSDGHTYGQGDRGEPGLQGPPGPAGLPGLQGVPGEPGAVGAPGVNGLDGLITSVDAGTKTASLIGRSSVSARLVVEDGQLRIVLATQ